VNGQFNSPIVLPSNPADPVPVSGPLLNVDPGAQEATIVCVLVQEVTGTPPIWVEGRGTWKRPDANWTGEVSRTGRVIGGSGGTGTLQAGNDVRGIAMAIAVKEEQQPPPDEQPPEEQSEAKHDHFVPPAIDTLTWCVHIAIQ
jgi:hypothetical protein